MRLHIIIAAFIFISCTRHTTPPDDVTVTCLPGERKITLVNDCTQTQIWAAAVGNAVATPSPKNGGANHTSGPVSTCVTSKDCPGVNQFCNTSVVSFDQGPDNGRQSCNPSTNPCTNGHACMSTNSYCANAQGQWLKPNGNVSPTGQVGCSASLPCSNTFSDPTVQCLPDNYCGTFQCNYIPVPLDKPVAANFTPTCHSNNDCASQGSNYFCYAPNGTQAGTCAPIPVNGNYWNMPTGSKVEICVPTPWAGRFFPRTNCTENGNQLTCDTGQCIGSDGNFDKNCVEAGIDSPTLAELYLPTFGNTDYYDISLVDGATVGMQIAPDSNINLTYGGSCTKDSDCTSNNGIGQHGSCDTSKGKCVNLVYCGSPGCNSTCDRYGYAGTGDTLTSTLESCLWSNGSDLAVASCPAALKGASCESPKDVCAQDSNNQTLNCSANNDLYACTGANAQSCYTTSAGPSCCGCPSWASASCANTNFNWTSQAQSYFQTFHNACPTAYSFAFDDMAANFSCAGKSAEQNVNYTITFCPK